MVDTVQLPEITVKPPGVDTGAFVAIGPGDEEATANQAFGSFVPISPNEPDSGFSDYNNKNLSMRERVGLPPQTSSLQKLEIDYNNQQAAAAQRTTPITSVQAPFALGPAHENDAGEVGYLDENRQFVPANSAQHVVLTDPETNTPMVYLRNDITNEGRLASAGRLLSTGLGPGQIETSAPLAAAQTAQAAADRLGVNVPRAIMSPSPATQLLGQVSAKMPGGGPLLEAVDQSRQELSGAVQHAVESTGGVVSPAQAGEDFQSAVQAAVKPTEGQLRPGSLLSKSAQGVEDAYKDLEGTIDPNVKTPLIATQQVASNIAARRGAATLGPSKAVAQVGAAIGQKGGLTFSGIKDLRTSVGEMLDGGPLPEGVSQTELRALYGSLSTDLGNAAKNAGGAAGQAAFTKANRLASMLADWKDRIRPIVGAKSGESTYQRIINMASAKPGSADIRNLAIAKASVPEEVWRNFSASAIDSLGKTPSGEWSPARFISDFSKLSDPGKKVLFGSLSRTDLLPFLNDIATVSQRFKEAGKLANTSGTAGHAVGAAAVFEAGKGLLMGSWIEPVTAVSALVGNNMMARILARSTTAAAMARWSNIYSKAIERGAPGMGMLLRSSGELVKNINSAFGTNFSPTDLLRSLQAPARGNAQENQQ